MKKLLFTFFFLSCINNVMSQHYGGLTFTPYAVENYNGWRSYSETSSFYASGPNSTFGFAVGYQGLLMPERRFSFSYGLLYTYGYNEVTYVKPVFQNSIGYRVDMKSLQIPLWWRYNILKNRKWQPFIAISTSVNYALVSERTFYYEDKPPWSSTINNGFFLSLELGVGVNYTTEKWMFTVQPTFGGSYARQLGIGFSVLRKF